MTFNDQQLSSARSCLEGLSVGDAFGERFFCPPDVANRMIEQRAVPAGTWGWTDDTAMALSVYECLRDHDGIDPHVLARSFADRYVADRMRGYGGGAHRLLSELAAGGSWELLAPALFGDGSYGNGAAMRVAPIGAYFSHDPELVVEHARLSALPTHAHPEGQAGAIAVAVAAGYLAGFCQFPFDPAGMFAEVLRLTPASQVRDGIAKASRLPLDHTPTFAAERLGNGRQISAQDTVPFCLWCVARHPDNFEEAMWTTVEALGDRDTTCAIVGSIIACRVNTNNIPLAWRHARESIGVGWPG